MTPKQMLAKWIRLLQLDEWEIELRLEPGKTLPEGTTDVADAAGQSDASPRDRFATIRVCKGEPDRIEGIIAHELIHVAASDLMKLALNTAELLGNETCTVLRGIMQDTEEKLVVKLETAFVRAGVLPSAR